MPIQTFDVLHLHGSALVDADELARMCGLSAAEISELVEYGSLLPVEAGGARFSAGCVPPLRTACRLRADFDLDLFTVSLLLGYLQRIAELEQHVRTLEAHLPHARRTERDGPAPWREPHA